MEYKYTTVSSPNKVLKWYNTHNVVVMSVTESYGQFTIFYQDLR